MTDQPSYFVVVSGLPGSGKSTLAHRLSPLLRLPVLDKDDELGALLALRGVADGAWRRRLSRESDEMLRRRALESTGALLVSFWRLPGMPDDSGTPTDWIHDLPGKLVHLWCQCTPAIAAERFHTRERHPGHLDGQGSYEATLSHFSELQRLEPLELGERILVDTSERPDAMRLAEAVEELGRGTGGKLS